MQLAFRSDRKMTQVVVAQSQPDLVLDPMDVSIGSNGMMAPTVGHQSTHSRVLMSQAMDAFDLLERGRFGRISDLRRNLTFIQLSGRLANVVYSMDATNTDFLAYQYKPVLNFLDSPSNGILIADEVGLGKTIEAGLIWTELRARDDACRRLVVVCPAMLRDKWSLELEGKFGIDPKTARCSATYQ